MSKLLLMMLVATMATGCAHRTAGKPDGAEELRQRLLVAEDQASKATLYRSMHEGACDEAVREANDQLNIAARQYFLLTNYAHPTIRMTALVLGEAHAKRAMEAATRCEEAFAK